MLLDFRWLSGIVGGLALGWGWFALCALIFGGRLLRPDGRSRRRHVRLATKTSPDGAGQPVRDLPEPGRLARRTRDAVPELLIDFITSLDGYGAADGWPGWWGLEGPEYLAWLGEAPEAGLHGPDGREHLPSDVGVRRRGRAGHRRPGGMSKVVFSSTLTEALVGEHAARGAGSRRGRARDEGAGLRVDAHHGQPHPVPLAPPRRSRGPIPRRRFPVITGSTGQERIYDGYPDVAST